MKKMKSIAGIITGAFMMFNVFAVSAAQVSWRLVSDGIWESRTAVNLGDGSANAVVIKADISDGNLKIDTLFSSSGTHSLDTVKSLADDNGAVVALNADFFAYGNSGGASAVGYNIKDSVLISSPSVDEQLASFAIDKNGEYIFDYFTSEITVETANVKEQIRHINRFNDYSKLCIFTPAWGKYSPGIGDGFEIVVNGGKVQEIRLAMEKTEIPQNGYVICGLTDWSDNFHQKVNVGDEITLCVKTTPEIDAQTVIGGGTLLVKNGTVAEITHNIKGRQPRSAFGMDKSGNTAYFIAVDGRGVNGSVGMTLAELQDFMINLGIYNGINFDGGGSTQMVVNYNGENQVSNAPSQHPYRNVINAIGIVSQNTQPTVYTSRYDFESSNGRTYAYPSEVTASYELTESKLTSGHKSGRLWYDFNDITSEGIEETTKMAGITFKNPLEIQQVRAEVSLDVYGFADCGQWLRGMVVDANGDVFRLTFDNHIDWDGWKTVSATVPDEAKLPAELTKIYIVQPSTDVKSGGELFFDNLTVLQNRENVKNEVVVTPDENTPDSETGNTDVIKPETEIKTAVAVSAGVVDNNTLLSRITEKKLSDAINMYEKKYVLLEMNDRFSEEVDSARYISLGQLKHSNIADNAIYLENEMENCENKNVVIMVNGEITSPYKSMIKDVAGKTGKNVTVIYISDEHDEFIENSVSYIALSAAAPQLSSQKEYIEMITTETGMFSNKNIVLWEK